MKRMITLTWNMDMKLIWLDNEHDRERNYYAVLYIMSTFEFDQFRCEYYIFNINLIYLFRFIKY